MNRLRTWYSGLQQREQRMVLFGGIALALIIVLGGIILPLESSLSSARLRRETQQTDLGWMTRNAAEIRAGGAGLAPDSGEAPVVIVDRMGREAGLTDALRGTQPSGSGVRVQLEAAPFDALINWIATLDQRYGFAIESITVDRAGKPGLVNASITFTQSRR